MNAAISPRPTAPRAPARARQTNGRDGMAPGAVWPPAQPLDDEAFATLARDVRACTLCRDHPTGSPLPHEPNPIFQISPTAKVAICSQAPGTRAHASGKPFYDPSGVRLRQWLNVDEATFYDTTRVAIVPMGLCFPGQDAKGGDLPPRRECAPAWRTRLLSAIGQPDVVCLIGSYAQRWHLGSRCARTLTETVQNWRQFAFANAGPRVFVLPHPSWRNNAWIAANPWFEREVLVELRSAVDQALNGS